MKRNDLARYNLQSVRAYLFKEDLQQLRNLPVHRLASQVPRRVAPASDALVELFSRPERVFQRNRGAEQRSQGHDGFFFGNVETDHRCNSHSVRATTSSWGQEFSPAGLLDATTNGGTRPRSNGYTSGSVTLRSVPLPG
jgi:hypothetical protein